MPVRQIIRIDRDKCTGCGLCIPNCPEGALQIIDGKAQLVCDLFCDGLGACIGHCPEGAITIEEREAEPYDEKKVMENVVKQGKNVIKAHLEHLRNHQQDDFLGQALEYLEEHDIEIPPGFEEKPEPEKPGKQEAKTPQFSACPGARMMSFSEAEPEQEKQEEEAEQEPATRPPSQLRQWPVQLKLLSPYAPYFKNADLVITADCVPFAYPDFHQKFLKRKTLIILCPKLDRTIEQYIEKLSAIFANQDVKSITTVHMEVPCCFGLEHIVKSSLKRSGKDIPTREYTISIRGEVIGEK